MSRPPDSGADMPRILIATRNGKKLKEMAALLADPRWALVSLADYPDAGPDVEETGATYEENAEIKAVAGMQATGLISIADDAGLEIDALGGEPGLRSRRFLGEETTFPEKMQRILAMLANVQDPDRTCRFRAAVAIAVPGGGVHLCRGICEGVIAREMKGSYGFGYDPIFFVPKLGRHMAELPPDEKHRISHRGQALACARARLERILGVHA